MQKYMTTKGQQILVETHLQNRNWEDDQGQKHYATDFIVERCYFADTKKEMSQETATEITNVLGAEIVSNKDSDLPF